MKQKLTITAVNNLQPQQKLYDVYDTEIPGFVIRVRPSGTKTYLLFYRNNDGKKRTYTIGKGITATQARDIAQQFYADIKRGIDINQRAREQRQASEQIDQSKFITFLENIYKDWLLENRASGRHTYNRLKNAYPVFFQKPLNQITQIDMERWKRTRKNGGISDSTLQKDVAELKAMLNRAQKWNYIPSHSLTDYSTPKPTQTKFVRYLSEDETHRLYAALEQRETERRQRTQSANSSRLTLPQGFTDYLMPMVLLALNTGMRRNELFQLLWNDVDFTSRHILVRAEVAKSKTERYIPMNEETFKTLSQWKITQTDTNGVVFPSKDGKPFDNIYWSWNMLLEKAKITNFRFHDLRHNFASQLVMNGIDLYIVKELLGHSSITVTERYAHLAPQKLADAVAVLGHAKL